MAALRWMGSAFPPVRSAASPRAVLSEPWSPFLASSPVRPSSFSNRKAQVTNTPHPNEPSRCFSHLLAAPLPHGLGWRFLWRAEEPPRVQRAPFLGGVGPCQVSGCSGPLGGCFFGQVGYSGPPLHQGVRVGLELGRGWVHRRGTGGLPERADPDLRHCQEVLLRLKQSPAEEARSLSVFPSGFCPKMRFRHGWEHLGAGVSALLPDQDPFEELQLSGGVAGPVLLHLRKQTALQHKGVAAAQISDLREERRTAEDRLAGSHPPGGRATHLLQHRVQAVPVSVRQSVLLQPEEQLAPPVGPQHQQVDQPLLQRTLLHLLAAPTAGGGGGRPLPGLGAGLPGEGERSLGKAPRLGLGRRRGRLLSCTGTRDLQKTARFLSLV